MTLHRPAPGRCAKSYGFILSDNCDNVKNSAKIRQFCLRSKGVLPQLDRTPLVLSSHTTYHPTHKIIFLALSCFSNSMGESFYSL